MVAGAVAAGPRVDNGLFVRKNLPDTSVGSPSIACTGLSSCKYCYGPGAAAIAHVLSSVPSSCLTKPVLAAVFDLLRALQWSVPVAKDIHGVLYLNSCNGAARVVVSELLLDFRLWGRAPVATIQALYRSTRRAVRVLKFSCLVIFSLFLRA